MTKYYQQKEAEKFINDHWLIMSIIGLGIALILLLFYT